MKNKPLVSVITPFFNTPPRFMEESIESVLAQRYSNWELLLVDDGSAHESTATARSYAENYPDKVRYLQHEDHQHLGASASRNLGLRYAAGEYIGLLDADDVSFPHKLEEQVGLLNAHAGAVMLYGNTQYWFSWTGNTEDRGRDFIPKLGVEADRLIDPPKLLPGFLQGQVAVPCTCSVLVRRKAIEERGGFENTFLNLYDDQVFYAKICLAGPVFVSGACWDRYRQHPESSCAVAEQTGQTEAIRLRFLRWLEDYLCKQGITDADVWTALQKELRLYENPGWLSWHQLTRYVERRSKKLWARLAERETSTPRLLK